MYIKLVTTKVGRKLYHYVKLVQASWTPAGSVEKVIATLGTLDQVLRSRETIIRGLNSLLSKVMGESPARPSRQKPRKISSPLESRAPRSGIQRHQTKTGRSTAGGSRKSAKNLSRKSRRYKTK